MVMQIDYYILIRELSTATTTMTGVIATPLSKALQQQILVEKRGHEL